MSFLLLKISSFLSLIFTYFLCLSTNSWILIWISLEINSLIFIYIMFNMSKNSILSLMIYYIIQSLSSMLFLFSMILLINSTYIIINNYMMMMMMIIKMGLWPFHIWMLKIVNFMDWISLFLMLTLQKVLPMFIYSNNPIFINMILIFSGFNSCTLMLFNNKFKSIMFLSSIIHLTWMIILFKNNLNWIFYLSFYCLIFIIFLDLNKKLNLFSTMDLYFSKNFNMNLYLLFIILMLSMSGFPPFLGFLSKFLMISNFNFLLIFFLLIFFSIFSCFIYLKMLIPLFINKFLFKKNISKFITFIIIIQMSFFILFICIF